jgi:hypothetical protein
MPFAPNVRRGFFPLDEELQLLPGHLTPSVQEGLVHLSTWMPFARAVKELRFFTHVTTTEPTVRRESEAAGAAYVAVQTEEVERLERELPAPPDGPPLQLLSVDGAFGTDHSKAAMLCLNHRAIGKRVTSRWFGMAPEYAPIGME